MYRKGQAIATRVATNGGLPPLPLLILEVGRSEGEDEGVSLPGQEGDEWWRVEVGVCYQGINQKLIILIKQFCRQYKSLALGSIYFNNQLIKSFKSNSKYLGDIIESCLFDPIGVEIYFKNAIDRCYNYYQSATMSYYIRNQHIAYQLLFNSPSPSSSEDSLRLSSSTNSDSHPPQQPGEMVENSPEEISIRQKQIRESAPPPENLNRSYRQSKKNDSIVHHSFG